MNQEDNGQEISQDTTGENENNEPTPESPERLIVPFEDPSRDFFSGLFQTMKMVLFQPAHFFRNYKMEGPIGRPLLFAVIVGWAAGIISILWGIVIKASFFPFFRYLTERMPEIEGIDWEQWEQWGTSEGASDYILGVLLAPLVLMMVLFIAAGLYHVFLMMVKGNKKNYETTFRVVAYGTASQVAEIIPIFGSLIGWVYGIILSIIGLTEAHETDSWKAVFAVFGPMVFCCFCCLFIIMVAGTGFVMPLLDKVLWK